MTFWTFLWRVIAWSFVVMVLIVACVVLAVMALYRHVRPHRQAPTPF